MKNQSTIFKWSVILVIFLIVLFLFRGCICGHGKPSAPEIITKIDTVWLKEKGDTVYQPVPTTVYYPKPYKITLHDTLETFEVRIDPADTAAILSRYFSTAYYRDTQSLEHGDIVIIDSVRENRIASRRLVTNFSFPSTTTYITKTQPKRTIFYVGAGIAGNQFYPIFSVEGSIALKFKNDKIWEAGYMLNKTGDPLYSLRFKLPIKFNK